ncbi:hypothetical protein ACFSKU_11460 [Pontibacter silvestris]|uniref:Potassium channel domain-containing protein n=1 Tax=Pontibacter silvestris TaxID=2305183 RepID=A0ABW4WZ16_9BACT|nr:hypothetical protein [Pontibacter silvestris]MCC9135366.1 hypothetical protein [Pontibacter silvestris]
MNLILLIPGIIILALVVYDVIYTTLAPSGAAPVSGHVSNGIWHIFYSLKRITGNRNVLKGAGVVIVVFILMTWVIMLWLANFLIFSSATDSVVNSTTNELATPKQVLYYTGYLLSTMGNGDYKAGTDNWRVYSAIISFSGLIMITIAITYVVPVVNAVTQRRALSIRIASIGHSVQLMLLNNWNGKNFKMLEDQFQELAQQVTKQGQLHFSYPVLHFFHHQNKIASLLPNLAMLDEAITILMLYIPEEKQPAKQFLIPLRIALTTFLQSLSTTFIQPSEEPPSLETEAIRKAGINLMSPDAETLEQVKYRRCILKTMVLHDGWEWEDLNKPLLSPKWDAFSKLTL